jgi:hypothetical protein
MTNKIKYNKNFKNVENLIKKKLILNFLIIKEI